MYTCTGNLFDPGIPKRKAEFQYICEGIKGEITVKIGNGVRKKLTREHFFSPFVFFFPLFTSIVANRGGN